MSKVSVNANLPSEKIINKVGKVKIKDHVIDAQGRVIKLKMPDALEEFDLTSALGQDSSNLVVSQMASSLLFVESIDNEPYVPPKSYAQIRAGIKKLGRDGIFAITGAVMELQKEISIQTEEEQQAEIKK